MQHKKKIFFIISILVLSLVELQAQESINAAGGNASGSGGSVSYSVGQVFYTTNSYANTSVAQGVQQPYEISVVSSVEEAKSITLSVSAYPNPATDYLQLQIEGEMIENLSYQLVDITGKLLQNQQILNNQTTIIISNYVSSTYFLKVFQGNKEIKTFKIIK
ncbi:MAG: T9SS type A sorting domain-containing protein, partial [Ignavibacteria bacterium]|nr:T9SS type A sorting domain-containing protein [Ignavibacteria bacterium]